MFPSPAELLRHNLRLWSLWSEASAVILMRGYGMAGLWHLSPGEMQRMVTEKAQAFGAAAQAGTEAAMRGQRPEKISAAALAPITRKARANRRRLSKAGPKLGF